MVGRGALRDPPQGTLCCLLARGTHALMAASKAKAGHYDVLPTPHRLADGALTHLPVECLFVVKRKGPAVGLSSLAAEVSHRNTHRNTTERPRARPSPPDPLRGD